MRGALIVFLLLLAAAVRGGPRPRHELCHAHLDLKHFEQFCSKLILENGRPFVLEPFQKQLLADYFAGASETLVLIPKKNGKSTLMAALVLYHLAFVDEARCYIAASSRDQATLIYDFAKGFVNRSPGLQKRILVRAGTRELRSRRDDGFVRVLAADSDTADGVGPTLAIVDELHRHKSTALYDVFRDGLDARDGAMLTITTAGDDEDGPLGQMRAKYLAMKGIKRRGRYTYARSRDRTSAMHEWALRPTDNLDDLDLVKSVNPLARMTKGKLRRRRNSPSMTTHVWARFACNVWAQDETAAIATLDWARIIGARREHRLPAGPDTDVVIGIDLGWTRDTTALVPVGYNAARDRALIDERLKIIAAPGDGTMLDEEVIKAELRAYVELWPGCRFALDPNAGGQSLAQWIERELALGDELRVVEHSQQPAPMCDASMHFSDGIRARSVEEEVDEDGDVVSRTVPIRHPDHAGLNRHVRAAQARWMGERWRFDKRKTSSTSTKVRPRPIDGVIGATLAYRALTTPVEAELEPFALVG